MTLIERLRERATFLEGEGLSRSADALVEAADLLASYHTLAQALGFTGDDPVGEALKALVPREPTEAMLDAAWHQAGESKEMRSRTHDHYRRRWIAMHDAALANPSPPTDNGGNA